MLRKSWFVVLSVGLVISMLVVGTVAAAGPSTRRAPNYANGEGICVPLDGQQMGGWQGRRGEVDGELSAGFMGRGGLRAEAGLVSIVAGETGLTVAEINALLAEGQTLGEIIDNAGADRQAVIDAFVAVRTEAIEAMVESGRITAEQAELMLAHLEEEVAEHLDETGAFMGGQGRVGGGRRGGGVSGGNPTGNLGNCPVVPETSL